ncbi:hypothetical protein K7X08_034473 [Anisodus acutangulus]|uniref:Uncharacterized protein n=1 Tax=Anisodus acutangulus TaxID=402998 RepID=A0A9Q1R306_9SOLA|nr:hypothetical protein K7X08_034473 [Anisodus acutangulus]
MREEGDMHEIGSYGVIDSANDLFGLAILGGGVGTREPKNHAISRAKVVKHEIIELTTVIILNRFYVFFKLYFDIDTECKKLDKYFRLEFKRIDPDKVKKSSNKTG